MNITLTVKHTADRNGQPLVCIENMPGEGAEFSVGALRDFAYTLLDMADECDFGVGVCYPETVEYDTHEIPRQNPFKVYRYEVCAGYSTAQRLAALVKHLYNGAVHPVRLDNLLANADERHTAIALTFSRRMSVGVMQARVSKIWTGVGKR